MEEIKVFIGTKIILARPMTKETFEANKQGAKICESEFSILTPGYLVQYRDGYQSWSPAAEFELAYREVSEAEKSMFSTPVPYGNLVQPTEPKNPSAESAKRSAAS